MTERLKCHVPWLQGQKCHNGRQKASSNYTPFAAPTVKLHYDQRSKVLQPLEQAQWLQIYMPEGQKSILTLNISESIQNYIIFRAVSLKFAPQRSLTFFASKNRKQLTYYLHYGPVSQWTWLPGKWRQQPPGDSWRHLAWQGIWQCCPHNYHKWDTIISYEASKTSCKWQIKVYD